MRNKTRQSSNVGSTSGQESGTLEDVVVVVVGGVSIAVEVEHQVVVVVRIQMMDLYGAPPNRSVNRHHHQLIIVVVVVVDCRLLVVVDQLTIHYRKSHREYPSNDEDWPPERPELPSSRDHTTTKKPLKQQKNCFFLSFFFKCFFHAHKFKWIQVEEVKNFVKIESAFVVGVGAQPELGLLLFYK